MFGREFRKARHRYHVPPPNPTTYTFEKVGSTKEALGLSGLSVGDEVYWYGGGDDVDTSASGVIVELPAVDPDGRVHSDMAAVEWSDDGYEIVEIDNLLNAEHYNIGQGYSQALGSRKVAWNRASDLSDDELLNQFGNGPMDDDEFDVLIMEVERRGLMDQWESRMSSRKQASSLTWGHETAEQSMLGEEVWFAYSGDGFNASITEESPGSGRFTVDAHTDSDLYKYLSTTEYGFESVDEAKSFVEQVFGYSRVSSRTAGKCSKCDGMGRETYETDSGTLSTQTCKACGGTGQAKESRRKRANGFRTAASADTMAAQDLYARFIKYMNDRGMHHQTGNTEFYAEDFLAEEGVDSYYHDLFWSEFDRRQASRRTAFPDTATAPGFTGKAWEGILGGGEDFHWEVTRDSDGALMASGIEQDTISALVKMNEALKRCQGITAYRTAFLDTFDLPEPRHRVAGWDWDDHLNGFIAAEAAREFTCSCGDNVPAPGYTDCRCGKRWNAYTISANGSQKMIAREVPVRENVVMARTARRKAIRKQAESGVPKFREGDMVIGRGPDMNTHTLREVGSVVEQDGSYLYRLRKLNGSGPGGQRLYAEEHLEGYRINRTSNHSKEAVVGLAEALTDIFEPEGWKPITGERFDWMKGDYEFYGLIGEFKDWEYEDSGGETIYTFTENEAIRYAHKALSYVERKEGGSSYW